MNPVKYNRQAWNRLAGNQDRWTIPVDDQTIEKARNGDWSVILTPVKPVPMQWFPDLTGLEILGLASGGGQQGPVLAAAGGVVTIFDNSDVQLERDRFVSDRHGLGIRTVQGDMRDLSVFPDGSFSLIFNPCSITFVNNLQKVWQECYRVLKPGGILMTGLINPLAYQIIPEGDQFVLKYQRPYSDTGSLDREQLETLMEKGEPLAFAHSLEEQIGGQLSTGFKLTDLFEDDWGGEQELDPYFPSFIATRSIK